MPVLTEETLKSFETAKRQTFHTTIVGTTFRSKEEIADIEDGDFALLTAEFDNEYDKNAVAVIHNNTGNHIGYIKRELNKDIWNNITKNNDLYICKITKTGNMDDKPNQGFNIKVIRMYFDQSEKKPINV